MFLSGFLFVIDDIKIIILNKIITYIDICFIYFVFSFLSILNSTVFLRIKFDCLKISSLISIFIRLILYSTIFTLIFSTFQNKLRAFHYRFFRFRTFHHYQVFSTLIRLPELSPMFWYGASFAYPQIV